LNGTITILSLVLWLCSSYIADFFYPTITETDINGYWDLKKVIYAIVIGLVLYSKSFVKTNLSNFFTIIFMGAVLEDVSDRLFFNIKVFEFNDFLTIDLTILFAFIAVYKIKYDFRDKVFNFKFFSNVRNKKL
jgi:hypothetical protein